MESPSIPEQHADVTVPRADGGKDAWLFLAGCFIFEALIWGNVLHFFNLAICKQSKLATGFPFSSGVFQSFYTTHSLFADHPKVIAVIETLSTGIIYFFAPISIFVLETWPSIPRVSSVVGLVTVVFGLAVSNFSTEVWHLVLTQGALYAIGGSLLYTAVYLDQWSIKKKGWRLALCGQGQERYRLRTH